MWLAGASLIILLLLTPLLFGEWRASRARAAVSHDPRQRIGLAWNSSKSAVRLLGVPVSNSDTAREVAAKMSPHNAEAASSLKTLAKTLDNATYSGQDVDPEAAQRAEQISKELAGKARESHTTTQWWLRHMNPLNVWRDKIGAWGNLR